jgi:polysaccharide deacetylase family protein (PEP-CTERM system associated)
MHLLTIDYEEWFHIFGRNTHFDRTNWDKLHPMLPEITHQLLQVLNKHQSKATFFCLGWVAQKYPYLIRDIQQAGHEIAAHSYWHQQVQKQSLKAFSEDLKQNIITLEQLTGQKINAYRAPAFTLFPIEGYGQEELLRLGIAIDSSVLSGINHTGLKIPNYPFRLQEDGLVYYPISTFGLLNRRIPYAGSGYFRLLPYHFIHEKLRKGAYHMLYFHPRDLDNRMIHRNEFSLSEKLRFNTNTKISMAKLEQLLSHYPMNAIRQIHKSVFQNQLYNFRYP